MSVSGLVVVYVNVWGLTHYFTRPPCYMKVVLKVHNNSNVTEITPPIHWFCIFHWCCEVLLIKKLKDDKLTNVLIVCDWLPDWQTDSLTVWQTDELSVNQRSECLTDSLAYWLTPCLSDWLTNWLLDCLADRWTEGQPTIWLFDWLTGLLTDWLTV